MACYRRLLGVKSTTRLANAWFFKAEEKSRNLAGSQWRLGPVHDDDWIVDLWRRASSLGQQVRCSALARLILEIGIGQRVAVSDRHAAGSDADYAALVRRIPGLPAR